MKFRHAACAILMFKMLDIFWAFGASNMGAFDPRTFIVLTLAWLLASGAMWATFKAFAHLLAQRPAPHALDDE